MSGLRRSMVRWVTGTCLVLILSDLGKYVVANGAEDVRWRTDYRTALLESRQKKSPLALVFNTPNCLWCRKQYQTTLRDPRIVALLNRHFIPLAVNDGHDGYLVDVLRIQGYPTVVLAAPDGKLLRILEGYQEADDFHRALHEALVSAERLARLILDYQDAEQAVVKSDLARAIPLLKKVRDAGMRHSVEAKAGQLLVIIERRAATCLELAAQMRKQNRKSEATKVLKETICTYPGTEAAKQAYEMLTEP